MYALFIINRLKTVITEAVIGNRSVKYHTGEILELIIGVMISFFPPKTGLIITVTLGNSYNYIAYC